MPEFRRSSGSWIEPPDGRKRFERWYRGNSVFSITARYRDRFPAFGSDDARNESWDRFEYCTAAHGFEPWVASLLDNHYHTLGYLADVEQPGPMMHKLHGSVAKLVIDLPSVRHLPFRRD